jgi:hypothetical protein
MSNSLLTTTDNPFNPFTNFDEWYAFDVAKGYYTCALLARVAITSPELSEAEQESAIEDAMNEIVTLNLSGVHRKVQSDYIPLVKA